MIPSEFNKDVAAARRQLQQMNEAWAPYNPYGVSRVPKEVKQRELTTVKRTKDGKYQGYIRDLKVYPKKIKWIPEGEPQATKRAAEKIVSKKRKELQKRANVGPWNKPLKEEVELHEVRITVVQNAPLGDEIAGKSDIIVSGFPKADLQIPVNPITGKPLIVSPLTGKAASFRDFLEDQFRAQDRKIGGIASVEWKPPMLVVTLKWPIHEKKGKRFAEVTIAQARKEWKKRLRAAGEMREELGSEFK